MWETSYYYWSFWKHGLCVWVRVCAGWYLCLLAQSWVNPRSPGPLSFFVVLLWPLVVRGLHDVIPSPWYAEVRMPTERTQRLHVCWGALFGNRRGSGEGRKKEDIPWISKKQRFIEVNCRLNIPWVAIGEGRATKRPSELTEVKSKFLVSGSRGAFYSESSSGARFSSTYLWR